MDREHRIYARREAPRKPFPFRTESGAPSGEAAGNTVAEPPGIAGHDDLRREVDRLLLSRYSPAGVLVDQDLEVLEIPERPGLFSRCRRGK